MHIGAVTPQKVITMSDMIPRVVVLRLRQCVDKPEHKYFPAFWRYTMNSQVGAARVITELPEEAIHPQGKADLNIAKLFNRFRSAG